MSAIAHSSGLLAVVGNKPIPFTVAGKVANTVFLVDMKEFPRMNEVYARAFGSHRPARTTVERQKLQTANGDAAEVSGDEELIRYMQRRAGYCLTGDVREQDFPIFYGAGANGKSTYVNAQMETMGTDYAMKANPELLALLEDLLRKDGRLGKVADDLKKLAKNAVPQVALDPSVRDRTLRDAGQ